MMTTAHFKSYVRQVNVNCDSGGNKIESHRNEVRLVLPALAGAVKGNQDDEMSLGFFGDWEWQVARLKGSTVQSGLPKWNCSI